MRHEDHGLAFAEDRGQRRAPGPRPDDRDGRRGVHQRRRLRGAERRTGFDENVVVLERCEPCEHGVEVAPRRAAYALDLCSGFGKEAGPLATRIGAEDQNASGHPERVRRYGGAEPRIYDDTRRL